MVSYLKSEVYRGEGDESTVENSDCSLEVGMDVEERVIEVSVVESQNYP